MLLLTLALSLALGVLGDFECKPPTTSNGPLPPVLPESYHMVYERNDLAKNQTTFIDVWYDWQNQQARVEEIEDNVGQVSLYDYSLGSYFFYYVPREGTEETSDERDFSCRYFPLSGDSDMDFHFYNSKGKPLRMVEIYQALLFGGRYRYAFAGTASDDSSRYIQSNKFTSCIVNKQTNMTLSVTYYWTLDESQPIKYEIKGETVNEVLSIVRFDRDPQIPMGTFSLPRHMECIDHPAVLEPELFPALSNDFAWREETLSWSTTDEGGLVGSVDESYREVWSSDNLKLARVDWTPSLAEVQKTFLESYANKPISIVADMAYGAVFITENINGQCSVKALTEEFPLSKKVNGSFVLKTPMELLGMDGPRIIKGTYLERNTPVVVYSTNFTDNFNADYTTAHEATFRADQQMAIDSYGAFKFAPVSQLSRRIQTDSENASPAKISFVQKSYFRYRFFEKRHPASAFEALGCIAHHKRKLYELRFPGNLWVMISKQVNLFLTNLRFEIYLRGNLSTVMRVQDLDAYMDGTDIIATMTLLEPLQEIQSKNDFTVDQAATEIAKTVDEGHFAVPFEIGEEEVVFALQGSFKESKLDKLASYAHLKRSRREVVEKSYATIGSGYGLGSLIAVIFVAFIVGVVGGFGIVYLKTKSGGNGVPDEVPLGDIERNETEEDLDKPGPSGWKKTELESMDE